MKKLWKSPWTWAVVCIILQLLNLIFNPGGIKAKFIVSSLPLFGGMAIMGMWANSRSNTPFVLSVLTPLAVAALLLAYVNLAKWGVISF